MENLSFDKVKIETSLAEEYIKKHDFNTWPDPGTVWNIRNKQKKVISLNSGTLEVIPTEINDVNKIGRKIARQIDEYADLFCQLEYLIRRTDVDDAKNGHIKLIAQILRCFDGCWNSKVATYPVLLMTETTPLYYLGYMAFRIYNGSEILMFTNKMMAPQCYLFHDICSQLGLDFNLYYINDSDIELLKEIPNIHILGAPAVGCTAVLTEKADLETVVDVFLNSSSLGPWKIDSIYVNESVYGELIYGVEWKCERMQSERWVDAFRTRQGATIVAGVGAAAVKGNQIGIESYRTTRELLTTLAENPPPYLCIWCNDSAEANEIALPSTSSVVWVNDYATFDVPPIGALAMYNEPIAKRYIKPTAVANLESLTEAWRELSLEGRELLIIDTIEKYLQGRDEPETKSLYDTFLTWRPRDSVEVKRERIAIVVDRYADEILMTEDVLAALKAVVCGYRAAYYGSSEVIRVLNEAGVPVVDSGYSTVRDDEYSHEEPYRAVLCKKKVVFATLGTVYAN